MATLMKRSPAVELDEVERWLDGVFSGMGFGPFIRPLATMHATIPPADVYVADGAYVIELEVPGFTEAELSLEVVGRLLTITGKHSVTKEPTKTFKVHERIENEFERTFVLPSEVDASKITSTFESGILRVLTPLPADSVPVKIPIRST